MFKSSNNRGFTLVELMVVVAIIALLTGIVMTNFGSARGKARDAKRISDIGHLQLVLELYFDRCNEYPAATGSDEIDESYSCDAAGKTITDYIAQIPTPPAGTDLNFYQYSTNGGAKALDYILKTELEYYNEVVKDGIPSGPHPGWTLTNPFCDNTEGSTVYCTGPK